MLKPSMQELLNKVGNRYLLVNLVAQRARDLSDSVEESGEALDDKAVKLALDEIAEGSIEYCAGPRIEAVPTPLHLSDFADAFLDIDKTQAVSTEEKA